MTRFFCLVAFCIGLVFIVVPTGIYAEEKPSVVVEKLHSVLLANMKDAKALKFEGRRNLLAPIVRDVFDLETMARVSSGIAWQKMSENERTAVVEAFSDWTIANYASQFDNFEGEYFEIKGEADAGRGNIMVSTEIHTRSENVVLDYRLRQTSKKWRIIDIYLDGSISQLALRRGEFSTVLGRGGVDKLVDHMRSLAAKLAAGV